MIGTLAPFLLNVSALRHLPAARVGVVATLEPVLATALAWAIHGEALAALQIAGGVLVVVRPSRGFRRTRRRPRWRRSRSSAA